MTDFNIKGIWKVLKNAGAGFAKHKVLKLSASLAYYTIFSIGPIMLVIIFLADFFYGKEAIQGTIYKQISGLVGEQSALQIQEIIKNASITGTSFTAIIGFVMLVVTATTVFADMQDSINSIWNLKVKTDKGWLKMLRARLLSFSIIASLSFLLLVTLVVNAVLEGFMNKLQEIFPHIAIVIIYVINILVTLIVVSTLFAIIFKVLPDAIIRWKDVAVGAIFTAVLFMIGKFLITLYINNSDLGSTYGSAGSIVILMLWVYYSATILYFGAEFTKAYAVNFGSEIVPDEYAVTVSLIQVETRDSVQENEKNTGAAEKEVKKVKDQIKKSAEAKK